MPSLQVVSLLADTIKMLPSALKEIPAKETKARKEILDSVTSLAEAISQALNIVSVRCGKIILNQSNLTKFREELVNSPHFLDEFRLNGVCATLGSVRAELRTILNMKTFSLRLFHKKQIEDLLAQIQDKERDLEEDFDTFFRNLSINAPTLKKGDVPKTVQYLRDCQQSFEEDVRTIRKAMREIENSL